ncbi:NAD(P)-dependent alcohol dehydrogenase [Catalinimonas sp. 4WD22]|uniref:NAD(P)-dependent alcohol dehydrogenase n=1 Tax=Catalinimonas locisalis TaxID=3133978 RepID=UPI003100CB1A
MHAIVINQYGSPEVLEQQDVPIPALKSGQVLVKVKVSSINPIDFKARQGDLKLFLTKKFPIILGHDFAGVVQESKAQSKRIKAGDRVYGMNPFPRMGAYGEYVAVPEKYLSHTPEKLDDTEAAAVPLAAMTALQALRDKAKLQQGQKVLINGASGGVGTFAVQIAKTLGAQVTGVCSSSNVELVKSLGADEVIDYKKQNFEDQASLYDAVFDAVGKSSFSKCKSVIKPKGIYISTMPSPELMLRTGLSCFTGRSATTLWVKPSVEDLNVLANYIDTGAIRPVIDHVYDYNEMQEAQKQAETERSVGKKVVKMNFPTT